MSLFDDKLVPGDIKAYAEVLTAFADGKVIQAYTMDYTRGGKEWLDWDPARMPEIHQGPFRVKPPVDVVHWRAFALRSQEGDLSVMLVTEADNFGSPRDKWVGFVMWLSDWKRSEVPK